MTFPPEAEIQRAVLQTLLRMGGQAKPREVVEAVTQAFQGRLTDADLAATKKNGAPLWENHVHWARLHLAQDGFIDRSRPGTWVLTDAGEQRAQASTDDVAPPTRPHLVAEESPTWQETSEQSPNEIAMSMLTALLHEISNAELPWTVDRLDDGAVTLSYEGRLRVILRP